MPGFQFNAEPVVIRSWMVVRLPKDVSLKLPSRGAVLVTGTANGVGFTTVLEPDGAGSHWFRTEDSLRDAANLSTENIADFSLEVSKNWPEPELPADLRTALETTEGALRLWTGITHMARWDWIRWIRSTAVPETRKRRIAAACDKLLAGERRPCCFNRNLCTETAVSHRGVLLAPGAGVGGEI